MKGIEPSPPAWKAGALPLSYTRGKTRSVRLGDGRLLLAFVCRLGSYWRRLPATPQSVDGVEDIQGLLDKHVYGGLALGAIVWSLEAEEDRLSGRR